MPITTRGVAVLSVAAIALYAVPVNSAPPPAVFKDSGGNVYVHTGVTAGSRLDVDFVGAPLTRKIRAGYCGQLTLSPSASQPSLGNTVTIGTTNLTLTWQQFPRLLLRPSALLMLLILPLPLRLSWLVVQWLLRGTRLGLATKSNSMTCHRVLALR